MSQYYGMINLPKLKVIGKFDRATGYIATDTNADIPASTLASPIGNTGVKLKNCVYNDVAECFHREPRFINRNSYVLGVGVQRQEAGLYADSDPVIEQGRRTFRAVPTISQALGGEPFFSPVSTSTGITPIGYPSAYRGPRWEVVTLPTESESKYAQFIQQTQASHNIKWALRQTTPIFKNQPFWIDVRKSAVVSPDPSIPFDPNKQMQWDDPAQGPYFAFSVGGYGGQGSKLDRGNSYTFVFPIGKPGYAIDNNRWEQAKSSSSPAQMTDQQWITHVNSATIAQSLTGAALTDSAIDFTITVLSINNRIIVTTSYGEKIVLPSPTYGVFNTEFDEGTRNKIMADRYGARAGFEIPSMPVEIRGCGFQCALNFNPMEFGTEDGVVELPPIIISKDQTIQPYFGTQSGFLGNYDTSENVEESPLCIPAGDSFISGGKGFGYDLNTSQPMLTTMGLPSFCLDVVRIGDVMTANEYFGRIGGGAETLNSVNELAQWTLVGRYSIVFKGDVNAQDDGRAGFSAKCSSAYKTAFWTRVLWRVKTVFESTAEGFDLTPYVKSVSFNDDAEGRTFTRRTATLTLRMPKPIETLYTDEFGYVSRTATKLSGNAQFTFAKLARNACILRFWVHNGNPDEASWCDAAASDSSESGLLNSAYLTGISLGGIINEGKDEDTLMLSVKDMSHVLQGQFILNSPYFDGMSLVFAVAHLLERGGIPALATAGGDNGADKLFRITERAREAGIFSYRLPDSGRFTAPALKLDSGKSPLDAIKKFCQIFWACFYVDGAGRFTLDTIEGTDALQYGLFRETNDLTPKVTFVTHPTQQGTDKYAWLLDRKITKPTADNWFNIFSTQTIDKFSGAILTIADGSLDSIVNPKADNFLGFPRATFTRNGAFGGQDEALHFIQMLKNVLSKPSTQITISVIGRSDLRINDIIKVDNNNFRITGITSEFTAGPSKWRMSINAEHLGAWNDDIDASAYVFS